MALRHPNPSIPQPNFLIPFFLVFLTLLLCLQPPMLGTEGSSTAHPPNTGISQACSRIPPQIPAEQHQGMEAPAQNVFREAAPGAQTEESCSFLCPHTCILFVFALWEGQTRTEGAQDTVGMSQHTDLREQHQEQPVGGRAGGNAASPQKCTQLGRGDHSSGTAFRT